MPRSYKRTADSTANAGNSPWARFSNVTGTEDTGFNTSVHSGATGTYSIQVTQGNPEEFVKAKYSRTTTTLTVTDVDHGLKAGDAANLQGTPWDVGGGHSLILATVADANTFTITVANTGGTAGSLLYAALPVDDLGSFSGVSGAQQGIIDGGVQMARIAKGGGTLSGKVTVRFSPRSY